ncbi:hypothetical protein [Pseudoalteromonas xiamenensis]
MRFIVALFITVYSMPSIASLKLDGFANIGASLTDSKYAGIRTQVSQHDALFADEIDWRQISSAGLQAEWRFSNQVQFVSQLVLKDSADHSLDDKIKMAFLRYSPSPELTVNLGRTAIDLYMMTDYRDIGYAYIPVHLPTEFYGIIPHESLNGLDISYKHVSDFGLITSKFFYGRSKAPVISDGDFTWEVRLKNIFGFTIQLEQQDWLVRVNHTQTTAEDGYPGQNELVSALNQVPDAIWPSVMSVKESLLFQNSKLTYSAVGARYDNADVILQGEMSLVDSKSILLNDLLSGYVSAGKRLGSHTLMLTYSHIQADAPTIEPPLISDPNLNALYTAVKSATDFYRLRQNTSSLSWRYDLSDTWSLKAQFDHTHVRYQPSGLYLHDFSRNPDGSFSTFSISSHWIFDL